MTDLEERFWSKVNVAGSDECWLWTAHLCTGYGRIKVAGKDILAHRVAYQLVRGDIPEGMDVDHRCLNRPCVNPAHLRLVTRKQNNEHQRAAYRNSRSGARGVHPDRGRWRATVRHNGTLVHVGMFTSIEEADSAARAKRLELFTHSDMDRQ